MNDLEERSLPMFDLGEPPEITIPLREQLRRIQWSYSKRNELEQCPRKYYFDYFGASARKAKSENRKPLLRKLKSLQNRHERAGKILHLVIARYFRSASEKMPLDEKGMLQWASKLFSTDVTFSRANERELVESQEEFPPAQLLEFFHGQSDAEDLCAAALAKLLKALETFNKCEALEKVRAMRGHPSVLIEKKFNLRNLACRVLGVVDFAARNEGDPGIVDWKIGTGDASDDDSLQLAVYAMWGGETFRCSPHAIRIFKAYLGSGEVNRFRSTEQASNNAQRRILQDAKRMLEMEQYGSAGNIAAFTACAQRRICSLCRYLTVCPEGMEAVR